MRCNWAKRILFLADRIALVNQAVGAFKTHLPSSSPVNLVTERDGEGRVYVSTYPTMMGLINEMRDGRRRFGPGHFDLIVIDEAHRSVYQKYRAIFDYFDSLLVGLTATPKDEIDINTYQLFDLERGVPTDAYHLDDAIKDGFLVPPVACPCPSSSSGRASTTKTSPTRRRRSGTRWSGTTTGTDPRQGGGVRAQRMALQRGHRRQGARPPHDERAAGRRRRPDRQDDHLRQEPERTRSSSSSGSTPTTRKFKGAFARTIHHGVTYAQTLIDDFSSPAKAPHIAVSVDMLDTGIDVPEVVNLVFFKQVHSKTKFWQMVGRGTRLRPDLFGPGDDKSSFYILDYCGNLEFFHHYVPRNAEGRLGESLSKRALHDPPRPDRELLDQDGTPTPGAPQGDRATLLHEVASMNLDNFLVRPKRRVIEQYARTRGVAVTSTKTTSTTLATEVAGLPSERRSRGGGGEAVRPADAPSAARRCCATSRVREASRQVIAIAAHARRAAQHPDGAGAAVLDRRNPVGGMVAGRHPGHAGAGPQEAPLARSVHREASRNLLYTDFTDEMGDEHVVRSPRYHTPAGHGAFPGEGASVPPRPPGRHRHPPAR